MAFKIRRGLDAERLAITPEIGEPIWATDTKKLWIGDGITAGGIAADAESYLSDEYLQDLTAAMLTSSPHSGIAFAYDDNLNRLVATVTFPPSSATAPYHFNVTGADSTLTQINRSETVQFLGQNGINVSVNDTGGTTIISIDGANVQGGGSGNANLEDVGWFVTGADSTQVRINNDETVQFLGDNGINITVDDSAAPARITLSGPVTPNVQAAFAIPYYTTSTGTTLATAGPDLRFMAEYGAVEINSLNARTIQEVFKTEKFIILNIQPNTPSAGRATITFGPTHPHAPYYNDRELKISRGTGPNAAWNGVYTTPQLPGVFAATTNTVIIVTNKTDPFVPVTFTVTGIGGTDTCTTSAPHGLAVNDVVVPDFTSNGLTAATAYYVRSDGLTSTQFKLQTKTGASVTLINGVGLTLTFKAGPLIQETSTLGINVFPNGENKFITFGGTINQNNGDGQLEYGARFRLLDNTPRGFNGSYSLAEFVQVHEDQFANAINITRGRGTFVNTAKVQAGDMLGAITFSGLDGVNSVLNNGFPPAIAAAIYVDATETPAAIPGAPSLAGRMVFQTAKPGAGYVLTDAMIIDEYAAVRIVGKTIISDTIKIEGNKISTINSNANLDISTNGTGVINLLEDVSLQGASTLTGTSWKANGASYVQLANYNLSNSVSVGDTGVTVTTNAIGTARNYYFNTDGSYAPPVLNAPPGTPTVNGFYVADGVSWDPASKSGAVAYPVFYDGVAYNALY